MTFLNASLLFGMAAIAVPVVLHLIAKREPKKVVFPSLRFLTKRFETNRAKIRIRRWWLLAMRIAALAALAAALARPAIAQSVSLTWLTIGLIAALGVGLLIMATVSLNKDLAKSLTYGLAGTGLAAVIISTFWSLYAYASGPSVRIDEAAPAAVAIILDNSPTSAWKTVDDDRIQRIKDVATWMVTRLPPTSRIAIVDRSANPATFSLDLASAVSKIDQLAASESMAPMAAKIDAAIRLVRTSELESRQILVISDLASATWQESMADSNLVTQLDAEPNVQLTIYDLGDFQGINRSVDAPTLVDSSPPRQTSVSLTTTLRAISTDEDAASADVTAELLMFENNPALPILRKGKIVRPAARPADRASAKIVSGGSSEIQLSIPPLDVGTHHGMIRLVGEDAFALDNQRFFTVKVLPPSHILLVVDDSDEARAIDLTINASPFEVDESSAEYLIERVAHADLPAVRLDDFDAVLLLDPPQDVLQDSVWQEFSSSGKSLLVCLGPSCGDDEIVSEAFPKCIRRWRSPQPHTFLEVVRPSHPILGPFADVKVTVPWNDYRVQQYWQIETDPKDKLLMRYAGTDHAALIERDVVGENGSVGRVVLCTTPLPDLVDAQNGWNDLFGAEAWPAFFLVRFISDRLTLRGADQWTTSVGAPHRVKLELEPDEEQPETRRLQLFPPGAESSPVPIDVASDASEVLVTDVSRSGTFWLRGGGENNGFSANISPASTELSRVDPASLSVWFGPEKYSLVTDQDEIELAEAQASQRVSLRSPLLLLALAVFVLEQILGNRFYRSSGSSAKQRSVSSVQGKAA